MDNLLLLTIEHTLIKLTMTCTILKDRGYEVVDKKLDRNKKEYKMIVLK